MTKEERFEQLRENAEMKEKLREAQTAGDVDLQLRILKENYDRAKARQTHPRSIQWGNLTIKEDYPGSNKYIAWGDGGHARVFDHGDGIDLDRRWVAQLFHDGAGVPAHVYAATAEAALRASFRGLLGFEETRGDDRAHPSRFVAWLRSMNISE